MTTRPPLVTYRLQLHPGFDFDRAASIADYLADLGVTHVYLSPVLQAAPGSTHGYDVVDHARPSEALGGEAGYARLAAALGAAGLGQVLDIVPNHMAIGARENRWWWDVLENGPSSLWAGHFDVTWDPPEEKHRNTVLLPILGDHYGRVLDRGEVRLVHERGEFTVRYHEHVLPVALRTLAGHLAGAAERAGSDDLAFVATALRRLPAATRTDRASMVERHRDTAVLRRQLVWLMEHGVPRAEHTGVPGEAMSGVEHTGVPGEAESGVEHTGVPGEAMRTAIDAVVEGINADVDALDDLLEDQNYRIAHWRTAGRELGYRRFFDINTLVGVRVEDPEVFADTHGLVLRWVREGVVDGLRVDHPDGLRDPERYFERLAAATGGAWVVAEKILEPGEELPPSWPVAGTTGYDRLAAIDGVLVDPAGEAPLTEAYGRLTGAPTDWHEVQREAKALAVREILAADVARLTAQLVEVCEGRRHQRDRTRHELAEALRELLTSFPVYRAYVRTADDGGPVVRPADVAHVEAALADVAQRCPDVDPDLLGFLGDLLLLRLPGATPLEHDFALQFQQLSGPAMAKGVEDTAFYRYTRLLALNEVGGDPGRFGVPVADFHGTNQRVHERWPTTMTTLSTHDTKRSADVRARLAVLSEAPEAWVAFAEGWLTRSSHLWSTSGGDPDRPTQWLLLQTLVGAWPIDADRAAGYLAKATKEAKLRTTWTEPDPDFDTARDAYVSAVLDDPDLTADVEAFVASLAPAAMVNGLAQQLLALTVPGVPDVYQGNELIDRSLVDPDNRRPVDFALRRRLLAELPGLTPEDLLARSEEGLPKLKLTREALHLRRRRPAAFGPGAAGAYRPLPVTGEAADHVVAFTRGAGPDVAVVVPRLTLRLTGWGDTAVGLPPGRWTDLTTGATYDEPAPGGGSSLPPPGAGSMPVDRLLERFPVALLEREG